MSSDHKHYQPKTFTLSLCQYTSVICTIFQAKELSKWVWYCFLSLAIYVESIVAKYHRHCVLFSKFSHICWIHRRQISSPLWMVTTFLQLLFITEHVWYWKRKSESVFGLGGSSSSSSSSSSEEVISFVIPDGIYKYKSGSVSCLEFFTAAICTYITCKPDFIYIYKSLDLQV